MGCRITVEHEPSGLYVYIEQTEEGEWVEATPRTAGPGLRKARESQPADAKGGESQPADAKGGESQPASEEAKHAKRANRSG